MIRDARSTRLAPAALAFPALWFCSCLPLAASAAVHCVQTPGQLSSCKSAGERTSPRTITVPAPL